MNATLQARTAYAGASSPIRTPRATEYEAFSRVTAALKSARDYPALIRALHKNRELWTLLAANVAQDDNAFPPQLRAQIFYLAEFTRQHTSKVIARKADSEALLDINAAIMHGLRSQGGTAG